MNFLALCNRLKRKARVSGDALTAVTGQIEEYSRLIDWINESWMDLQLAREDWHWMRTSASCATVLNQATYTATDFAITDLGNWERDSFRVYLTTTGTAGEQYLSYTGYDGWRDTYQFGPSRTAASMPTVMTITPANAVGVGPVPLAGYTITGDYFKVASELAATTDIPALPTQFHMAIVYRAMMFYGASEAASEIYQEGETEFKRFMRMLVKNQLTGITVGGALA